MEQLFGGKPLGAIVRLIIISIIVGIVMSALGIRPDNIFYHLQILIDRIRALGFGVFEHAFRWFLVGAVIVVPIWLISRLVGAFGRRDDRRN